MLNSSLVVSGYLTKDNCTTEVVGPIVTNIKGVIADATVKVKALSNQPADIVLGVGVDVTAVAQLIADLLNVCTIHRLCAIYSDPSDMNSSSLVPSAPCSTLGLELPSTSSFLSSLLWGKIVD